MKERYAWLILLFLCLFSRIWTSFDYIEDPQSLRYALAVLGNDQQMIQSGSPLLCLTARAVAFVTGNLPLSFSIIGGLSLFGIIAYMCRLLRLPLLSLEGGLLAVLLFFNPLLGLASNKYQPYILGTFLCVVICYFLLSESTDKEKPWKYYTGCLLCGLLTGVEPIYLAFIIAPIVYALFRKRNIIPAVLLVVCGVLISLLPSLLLYRITVVAPGGLGFTEYDPSLNSIIELLRSLWADGLGGYWPDRGWFFILPSMILILLLFFGVMVLLDFGFNRQKIGVVVASVVVHCTWVGIVRSNAPVPGDILPVVPIMVAIVAYGIIYFLVNFSLSLVRAALVIFFLFYSGLSVALAIEQKKPASVAQVKAWLSEKETREDIISSHDIIYYLGNGEPGSHYHEFWPREGWSVLDKVEGPKVVITSVPHPLGTKYHYSEEKVFNHNPYISRYRSRLYVYRLN